MNDPNKTRASRAAKAIATTGYTEHDLDWQSAVSDLLTDVRHLADFQGLDFDAAIESSATNHATEVHEDAIAE